MANGMVTPSNARFLELKEQYGTLPAKRIATKEALVAAVDSAESLDDIKAILRTMLASWP